MSEAWSRRSRSNGAQFCSAHNFIYCRTLGRDLKQRPTQLADGIVCRKHLLRIHRENAERYSWLFIAFCKKLDHVRLEAQAARRIGDRSHGPLHRSKSCACHFLIYTHGGD